MVQFEVPAIVPADPDANVADLLVKRVEATPDRALFSVPEGEGGETSRPPTSRRP